MKKKTGGVKQNTWKLSETSQGENKENPVLQW